MATPHYEKVREFTIFPNNFDEFSKEEILRKTKYIIKNNEILDVQGKVYFSGRSMFYRNGYRNNHLICKLVLVNSSLKSYRKVYNSQPLIFETLDNAVSALRILHKESLKSYEKASKAYMSAESRLKSLDSEVQKYRLIFPEEFL